MDALIVRILEETEARMRRDFDASIAELHARIAEHEANHSGGEHTHEEFAAIAAIATEANEAASDALNAAEDKGDDEDEDKSEDEDESESEDTDDEQPDPVDEVAPDRSHILHRRLG